MWTTDKNVQEYESEEIPANKTKLALLIMSQFKIQMYYRFSIDLEPIFQGLNSILDFEFRDTKFIGMLILNPLYINMK